MDWKKLALDITLALLPVALAVLAWLSAEIARRLRAGTRRVATQDLLLLLNNAVYTAVREAAQIMGDDARKRGKLSAEEAVALLARAAGTVAAHLGQQGLLALQALHPGKPVAAIIEQYIEAAVREMKGKP